MKVILGKCMQKKTARIDNICKMSCGDLMQNILRVAAGHLGHIRLALALGAAMLCFAAADAYAEEVVYKKHTVVDFGDDTIEGDLSKPDGQYLESRKRLRHQRLIKLRSDFRLEILRSVRAL